MHKGVASCPCDVLTLAPCGRLWISYRGWVDQIITARAGRAENFHSFVYAHTLGLPSAQKIKTHWSGSDAADLLACLAHARLLYPDTPFNDSSEELHAWLEESLVVFDNKFLLARERGFEGLNFEAEGKWSGPYDFVQLADPQLGMLHFDRDWTEELTMLRLAVQHVNRLVSIADGSDVCQLSSLLCQAPSRAKASSCAKPGRQQTFVYSPTCSLAQPCVIVTNGRRRSPREPPPPLRSRSGLASY